MNQLFTMRLITLWLLAGPLATVRAEATAVLVSEGQSVTLQIGGTDGPRDAQLLWTFQAAGPDPAPLRDTVLTQLIGGEVVRFNTERFGVRLQVDPRTGSLTVQNLRRADSGVYQLQVINGKISSHPVNLVVGGAGDKSYVSVTANASSTHSVQVKVEELCSHQTVSCACCFGHTGSVVRLVLTALVGVALAVVLVHHFRLRGDPGHLQNPSPGTETQHGSRHLTSTAGDLSGASSML